MKLSLAVTAIALATLALGATEVQAQTLTACYVKNTGTVYRINTPNAPSKCGNGHVEFSWNQAGQPGAQGEIGPQGPTGPSGFKGVVDRYVLKTVGPNETFEAAAACMSGEVLMSGGYRIVGDPSDFQVLASMPNVGDDDDDSESSWYVRIKYTATSGSEVQMYAYVVCMQVA